MSVISKDLDLHEISDKDDNLHLPYRKKSLGSL